MTEQDLSDLEPGAGGSAIDLVRLVVVLGLFIGLALILMAATHAPAVCGGG